MDELVNAHEHVTSTDPIPIAWFIILLHLGKALKSEIIEEKALLEGNNHFFTFINSMNFGKVDCIESNNSTSIIEKLMNFIQG